MSALGMIMLLFIYQTSCIKIFLLGGAVPDNQTDVYQAMLSATLKQTNPYKCGDDWATTTCPKVAVVTSAAQNQQQGNYYYFVDQPQTMCFKKLFDKYGGSPKHASVHRDNYQKTTNLSLPQGQYNLKLLQEADLIFFDGGDQIRHSRCWLSEDGKPIPMLQIILNRALADKVILGGTSAGTMIWSNPAYGGGSSLGHLYFSQLVGLAPKKIADGAVGGTGLHDARNGTSGLQYQQNGAMFTGFGQLPFLLDTHFDVRGRLGRIIPALIQTKTQIGIGLDEPVCLYYNNGIGTVYGKGGVFIVDVSRASSFSKQYFSINNVSVSYLTVGDIYNFKENKLFPSTRKHPISQPLYKTQLNSIDILSSYQCTILLTRLVDQTPSYNEGRTRTPTPKQFPKTTPQFHIIFQRGAQTQGFYSTTQKIYTVNRAQVHIIYK